LRSSAPPAWPAPSPAEAQHGNTIAVPVSGLRNNTGDVRPAPMPSRCSTPHLARP